MSSLGDYLHLRRGRDYGEEDDTQKRCICDSPANSFFFWSLSKLPFFFSLTKKEGQNR